MTPETDSHPFFAKRFAPLFWTQFSGAFNDNFLKNALVILVTFQSVTVMGLPPSQIVAVAGGIFILPFFLFSALAGQIADKFEKGSVIRTVKFVEIVIMGIAIFGFVTESYALLLLVLFLMGLHSTFFGPLKYSILPQHLHPTELLKGTALVEAGTFIAILLGTISGGVLIATSRGVFYVCAGLTLVAVLGFLTSQKIPEAKAPVPELKIRWNPISPTFEIFRFARERMEVMDSIWAISWFWFLGMSVLSLFPPLGKDVLHGNEHMVTLFMSLFSVGVAIGSMIASRLCRSKVSMRVSIVGGLGMSASALLLFLFCEYFAPRENVDVEIFLQSLTGVVTAIAAFLFSVFGGMFIVPLYTLMQKASDSKNRSRIIAANNIMNAFLMCFSALGLVLLMQAGFSIPQIFGLLSILNLIATLWIGYRSRLHKSF